MFSAKDLEDLASISADPGVSLYLPTHRAAQETRQDPIRLAGLRDRARDKLIRRGLRPEAAREFVQPLDDMIRDNALWRHQDLGLAIFLTADDRRVFKLPSPVAELAVVAPHFHVTPLLPLLGEDRRFWVLALSAGQARLLGGGRYHLEEMRDIDLPQGVASVYAETEFEEHAGANPMSDVRANRSGAFEGAVPAAQNSGEDADQVRKNEMIEYLRRVNSAVERHLAGDRAPLLLVAQPEIGGHFRAVSRLPALLPAPLECNPDGLRLTELHQKAYGVVRPLFRQDAVKAVDHFNSLFYDNDARATTTPEQIVKAARYGQVDTLVLAEDVHLWGRYDEAADRVVAHGHAVDGDEDLFNYAALFTLKQGGQVKVLPRGEFGRAAGAILRWGNLGAA